LTHDTDGTDGHPGPLTAPEEIERLTLHAVLQGQKLVELEARVRQLQTALDSRLIIERANGILAERYDLSIDQAFALLRDAARTSRRPLRQLARDVVEAPRRFSPAEIVEGLRRLDYE
jgi:AmiR/NasT family two-component response regulator